MSIVWFNGEVVQGPIALASTDRGLMLGDGLFETIAVRNGRAIWLDEHLHRLSEACAELGMEVEADIFGLGLARVLQGSKAPHEILRITVTRGVTVRGLAAPTQAPSLLFSLTPFDPSTFPKSVRLATSLIRRNESAPSCRLKTLSYIDAIAAAREVVGKADDALMLNTHGHVACSTVGNVFVLKDGVLLTPQQDQGILPGIARGKILGAFKAREAVVTLEDVHSADALFLTNSLRLVTQASHLDGKALGDRSVQMIKQKLEELF
ncbi:MAG: aminotransferase class IV [Alphaproteobacteria bacterium]|nr:aminotransferase class IV [Alphaproteobacteria bacterium]